MVEKGTTKRRRDAGRSEMDLATAQPAPRYASRGHSRFRRRTTEYHGVILREFEAAALDARAPASRAAGGERVESAAWSSPLLSLGNPVAAQQADQIWRRIAAHCGVEPAPVGRRPKSAPGGAAWFCGLSNWGFRYRVMEQITAIATLAPNLRLSFRQW